MIYLLLLSISLATASIESISYLGFIVKHTGISPYLIYLTSLFLAPYAPRQSKLIGRVLGIVSVILLFILFSLSFAEGVKYPNYVFTHTHINLVSFQFLIVVVVTHAVFLLKNNLENIQKMGLGLLIGILICTGTSGLGRTMAFVSSGVLAITANPWLTYEQKMIKVYPGLYPALREVARLTPDNATILIPPQANPWEFEGNGAIVTYFVYPRHVINLPVDGNIPLLVGPVYILIARGSWPNLISKTQYGWPKIAVNAKRIWQFNLVQNNTIEYSRNYDPSSDIWDWGLIEVLYD